MFKEATNTKFLLFYIVLVYVFAFMFWWSYLLHSKIEQHFSDAVNYQSLQYELNHGGNFEDYIQTEEYQQLDQDFSRQQTMIIGEGAVFFIVLIIGMVKIYRSFKQEIAVARQQKNFILSITHELKSPLASIKLMNETIRKHKLDKQKQDNLLASSLSEVDRLENLVENILIAAKIENDQYGFNREELDLSIICNQVFESYKSRQDIELKANIKSNVLITGDKTCINSILSNLLDNAIKYAPNSAVSILLKRDGNKVELSVCDTGSGIPDEEKQAVFDKFYRLGNEETRQAKGTGLGLYIVRQLVNFHDGKIQVENNQPQGTCFIMVFKV